MFNPFKKVFPGLIRKPLKKIESEFARWFPHAINVEWCIGTDVDEAIFYENEREVIARFDKKGSLIDYKINLDINFLPDSIKVAAIQHGEIMNAIGIYQLNGIEGYEIIFRDENFTRFTMLTSAEGIIQRIQLL